MIWVSLGLSENGVYLHFWPYEECWFFTNGFRDTLSEKTHTIICIVVGGIPTPLKIWKSVGVIIPNIWKNEIYVPNHQPVYNICMFIYIYMIIVYIFVNLNYTWLIYRRYFGWCGELYQWYVLFTSNRGHFCWYIGWMFIWCLIEL